MGHQILPRTGRGHCCQLCPFVPAFPRHITMIAPCKSGRRQQPRFKLPVHRPASSMSRNLLYQRCLALRANILRAPHRPSLDARMSGPVEAASSPWGPIHDRCSVLSDTQPRPNPRPRLRATPRPSPRGAAYSGRCHRTPQNVVDGHVRQCLECLCWVVSAVVGELSTADRKQIAHLM